CDSAGGGGPVLRPFGHTPGSSGSRRGRRWLGQLVRFSNCPGGCSTTRDVPLSRLLGLRSPLGRDSHEVVESSYHCRARFLSPVPGRLGEYVRCVAKPSSELIEWRHD